LREGCQGQGRRRRCKSVLTIPERASTSAASLWDRLTANNRMGGGGVKARNIPAQERNLSITITQNHSRTVRKTQNGNFIITFSREGSSSTGRGGEVTCRQGMGTSSSLTWLGVPDTQGTWGLQQETRDLGKEGGCYDTTLIFL
jgi:hypothetical protein